MTQQPCVRRCLCYLVFVAHFAVLSAKFSLKMFFKSVSINHFARNCKAQLLDFWIKVGDHIPEHFFLTDHLHIFLCCTFNEQKTYLMHDKINPPNPLRTFVHLHHFHLLTMSVCISQQLSSVINRLIIPTKLAVVFPPKNPKLNLG